MIAPGVWALAALLAHIPHGIYVSPALAHDNYSQIFNFAGVRCCNGQDCQRVQDPRDFKSTPIGYEVKSTGEVVPLAYTGFSPDNGWHICRMEDPKKTIRCLLIPNGGS